MRGAGPAAVAPTTSSTRRASRSCAHRRPGYRRAGARGMPCRGQPQRGRPRRSTAANAHRRHRPHAVAAQAPAGEQRVGGQEAASSPPVPSAPRAGRTRTVSPASTTRGSGVRTSGRRRSRPAGNSGQSARHVPLVDHRRRAPSPGRPRRSSAPDALRRWPVRARGERVGVQLHDGAAGARRPPGRVALPALEHADVVERPVAAGAEEAGRSAAHRRGPARAGRPGTAARSGAGRSAPATRRRRGPVSRRPARAARPGQGEDDGVVPTVRPSAVTPHTARRVPRRERAYPRCRCAASAPWPSRWRPSGSHSACGYGSSGTSKSRPSAEPRK